MLPVLVAGLLYLLIANFLAFVVPKTSQGWIGLALLLLMFAVLVLVGRQLGKHG